MEEEQQEDRPSPEKEGGERRGTRRDRRARAAAVFISRETPLHWPKSSPVRSAGAPPSVAVPSGSRIAPPRRGSLLNVVTHREVFGGRV